MDIRIENFSNLSLDTIAGRIERIKSGFPEEVGTAVREIIGAVAERGDEALVEYTKRFDGVDITSGQLRVTEDDIAAAQEGLDSKLRDALKVSVTRVEAFHRHAVPQDWDLPTLLTMCWARNARPSGGSVSMYREARPPIRLRSS